MVEHVLIHTDLLCLGTDSTADVQNCFQPKESFLTFSFLVFSYITITFYISRLYTSVFS